MFESLRLGNWTSPIAARLALAITLAASVTVPQVAAQQSPTLSQLQAAFGSSSDVRVVVITPEKALADLKAEYQKAARASGAGSADARAIADQIEMLQSQMARQTEIPAAQPQPAAIAPATQADEFDQADQASEFRLTAQQLSALQAKYVELAGQLGVNHPSVVRLDDMLRQIERGTQQAIAPAAQSSKSVDGDSASPAESWVPSTINPASDRAMVDPVAVLSKLVDRIGSLEQEVRGLRREIQSLRSEIARENNQAAVTSDPKHIPVAK